MALQVPTRGPEERKRPSREAQGPREVPWERGSRSPSRSFHLKTFLRGQMAGTSRGTRVPHAALSLGNKHSNLEPSASLSTKGAGMERCVCAHVPRVLKVTPARTLPAPPGPSPGAVPSPPAQHARTVGSTRFRVPVFSVSRPPLLGEASRCAGAETQTLSPVGAR